MQEGGSRVVTVLKLLDGGGTSQGIERLVEESVARARKGGVVPLLIVLPNRRHLRPWRMALLKRLGPKGVLPSEGLVTAEDLSRRILPGLAVASRPQLRLALLEVLAQAGDDETRPFGTILNTGGVQKLLLRSIRELRRSGFDGASFLEALGSLEGVPDASLALARIHVRLETWLHDRNLHFREDLPRIAARRLLATGAAPGDFLARFSWFAWLAPSLGDAPALELLEVTSHLLPEGTIPIQGLPPKLRAWLQNLPGASTITETPGKDRSPELWLVEGSGRQGECRALARFVHEQRTGDDRRSAGLRIVLRHPRRYGPPLRKAFSRLGLDLNLERSLSLAETALARCLFEIIRMRLESFPPLAWLKALEAPLLARAFEDELHVDLHALEAALIERGLPPGRVEAWNDVDGRSRATTLPLDPAWGKAVGRRLREVEALFALHAPPREHRRALERLLRSFRVSDAIAEGVLGGLPPHVQALEARAMSRLVELADEVAQAAERVGKDAMPLKDFLAALEAEAREVELAVPCRNRHALPVLAATDLPPEGADWLILPGLLEGAFPTRSPANPLLDDGLRSRLRSRGPLPLPLETAKDRREAEEGLFWQILAGAGRGIVLSHPRCDDDGSPTLRSFLLDELERRENGPLARWNPGSDRPFPESAEGCHSLRELVMQQIDEAAHQAGGRGLQAPAFLDWASPSHPFLRDNILSEGGRSDLGRPFDEWDGRLTSRADAADLVARRLGDRPFSASQLALHGRCPFAYFARYVLKLREIPPPEASLPAVERGRLLHEICRRFFELHPEALDPSRRADALQSLGVTTRSLFAQAARDWPGISPRLIELERGRMVEGLEIWLDALIARQAEACERRLRPRLLEWAFGEGDKADDGPDRADPADPRSIPRCLELADGSGKAYRLRGRVDRVDLDGEEAFFRVVDYKSSLASMPSNVQIHQATDIQGHLYVEAVRSLLLPHAQPLGWLFEAPLAGGRRSGLLDGTWTGSLIPLRGEGRRTVEAGTFQAHLEHGLERAGAAVDAIRRGDFRLDPAACLGTRCAYRDCCRYSPFRSDRKREAARLALNEVNM